MKQCFKCGAAKPLEHFYKHPQMKDGHLNKCKECTKRDVKSNYIANRDHFLSYEKSRANAPHRAAARKAYSQTAAGKCVRARANRRYQAANPEKSRAKSALRYALRAGKLTRKDACEICGNLSRHGHHHDYKKPLDVWWLCTSCHALLHRLIRSAKRAQQKEQPHA